MLIIGSILLLLHQVQGDCTNENKFTASWSTGANGAFSFKVPESTSTGWTIKVTFDKPVTNLNVWNGQNEQCNGNVCTFSNKNWNKRHRIYISTVSSKLLFKLLVHSIPSWLVHMCGLGRNQVHRVGCMLLCPSIS